MKRIVITLLVLITISACSTSTPADLQNSGKIKIATSSYGLAMFLEKLGGNEVEIVAIYSDTRDTDAKKLLDSATIFIDFIAKGSQERANEVLESAPNIQIASLPIPHPVLMDGNIEEHKRETTTIIDVESSEINPYVWLDPVRMQEAVVSLHDVLTDAKPDLAAFFDERTDETIADLKILDKKIRASIPKERPTVYISDNSFSYFSEQYTLKQEILSLDVFEKRVGENINGTQIKYFVTDASPDKEKYLSEKNAAIDIQYLDNLLLRMPNDSSYEDAILATLKQINS